MPTVTRFRALIAALLVAGTAAACSSGSGRAAPTTTARGTTTPATAPPTTAPAAPPAIPWTSLHNPLLRDRTHAVKDAALVFAAGKWRALFSYVDDAGTWRIGVASSADLRQWSPITTVPHDPAVEGEASPDVVHAPDGRYVITYQSFVHDRPGTGPKLYYRTTEDFAHFTAARSLGHELHPGASERMIDAAVAWTPAGLLLGYKMGADTQHFEIARSASGSLDGPWTLVGRPDIVVFGDTIENYQFLHLHDGWQLLATSNILDRPYLFDLAGDPKTPSGWLHWTKGRELQIPTESWNPGTGATGGTYEHANCAFVVNSATFGGYSYLVYSDSPNKTTFGGEGPAVLALARSRDLVSWSVPPY